MEIQKITTLLIGALAVGGAFFLGVQWGGLQTEKRIAGGGAVPVAAGSTQAGMGQSQEAMSNQMTGVQREIDSLKEQLVTDPDNASVLAALGAKLYEAQQCDEAVKYLDQAVTLEPGDPNSWNDLALCYFQTDKRAKALEAVEKSIQADPEFQYAYLTKGFLQAQVGNIEEARAAWQKALDINPDSDAGRAATEMMKSHTGIGKGQKEAETEPGAEPDDEAEVDSE